MTPQCRCWRVACGRGPKSIFKSDLGAEEWNGDLLHGVSVYNLVLATGNHVWLKAERLVIRIDPFPLLLGLTHIKKVEVDGLCLTVVSDDQNNFVLPFLQAAGKKSFGINWRGLGLIDRLTVRKGRVRGLKNGDPAAEQSFERVAPRGKGGFSLLPAACFPRTPSRN